MIPDLATFIDLKRYPLMSMDRASGQANINHYNADLEAEGVCVLPGFLKASTISTMLHEVAPLLPNAIPRDVGRPIYGWMDNTGFPASHPRGMIFAHKNSAVTLDKFGKTSSVRRLYFWECLTEFVRRCLGYDSLYCMGCPHLSLELKVMHPGDTLPWHFDTNDGVVSLLLQKADKGGEFEYAPYVRSEDDENYPEVVRVIDGRSTRVRSVETAPGSLILFKGRRCIHRVTPIGDSTKPRLILLLSYDRTPDMRFPEQTVQAVINPAGQLNAS